MNIKKQGKVPASIAFDWPFSFLFSSVGDERPQVWRVFPGVHPVCQSEEAYAHPQQRQTLPVSRLLQELYPETDPEDPHDRPPAREAI